MHIRQFAESKNKRACDFSQARYYNILHYKDNPQFLNNNSYIGQNRC